MPDPFKFPGFVYAVTPDQADTPLLLAQVHAVLAGGARLLQYRDKISPMAEKLRRARALAALCRQFGAKFIVNDDVVLAVASGADGVHLGATDGSIRDARRLLPPGTIIGASCYNDLALAQHALAEGASYVAFGACFDSPTKPAARRVTPNQLADFRAALGPEVPICGIGGITHDNYQQLKSWINAVALVSQLFGLPEHPTDPDTVRSHVGDFLTVEATA